MKWNQTKMTLSQSEYNDIIMTPIDLCATISRSLPALFQCTPAPIEGIRVRTPMMYPDGGIVDVFVLERDGGYTVTDFGDSLGWLYLQSVSSQRSRRQQMLIEDVCQTLRIELFQEQLVLRSVESDRLAESVLRVAEAAVRVSDLWFTSRSQSLQTTSDDIEDWLREKQITFESKTSKVGRSTRNWTIDFETQTDNRTSLVFLLSTGSRGNTNRLAEHVLAACVDLNHLKEQPGQTRFISLFDDWVDVWREEHFNLLDGHSEIAFWSQPELLERMLRDRRQSF